MDEKTSIKQLIQGMTGDGVEVLQGIVKSENPLKIQIVNDEKLVIGANSIYVPRHLTDYTVFCSLSKTEKINENDSSQQEDFTAEGNLTIYNALKVGEKVHVLSFHHGKQYYILDRIS